MAKKEERFEVTFRDGSQLKDEGVRQIFVDKETGVNYLCWKSGYGAAITPLLDSEGKVVLCNREYQEGDAKGADLVIAASNCREVNRRVYEECQKAHIPVNTADDRELCDFYFPSVVLAEDIVIGLNSIDHDPKKVKEARKIIENVFDNERDYRS